MGVGGCFSDGGRPMGGDINFGGGGEVSKKIVRCGGGGDAPTMGNPGEWSH